MKRSVATILLSLALAGCSSKTAPPPPFVVTPTPVVVITEQQDKTVTEVQDGAYAEPAPEIDSETFPESQGEFQPQSEQSSFDPRTPEVMRQNAQMGVGIAQQRLSLCQYGYQMAQQLGDQGQMNQYQQEMQMHQAMLAEYQSWLADPHAFADEASCLAALARMQEYDYRSNTRDMRPLDQIQNELAQYVAHAAWKAGTPEGQQAHQQDMAALNAQGAARTERHKQNMANMNAQADARNRNWAADQQADYEQHQRNVHSIYNEYEYQDPTTGQRYWVPMENENPAVVNPDGSFTELVPHSSGY